MVLLQKRSQDGIGRSNIMEAEGILKDLIDDKVNNVDAELHVLQEEHEKDLLEHDSKNGPKEEEAQEMGSPKPRSDWQTAIKRGEYPSFPLSPAEPSSSAGVTPA
uniref:Uncharacterized protein n=1 Tax=Oryza nivara TaxID=4536 RepID=A0A0E0GQ80_ORYNI